MLAAGYESEFNSLLNKVQGQLTSLRGNRGQALGDSKSQLRQLQIDVKQLDSVLRRLQVESRGNPDQE